MSEPIVNTNKPAAEEAKIHADPTWKAMYRVGGVCLILTGLIYLIGAVFAILQGPPPSGDELYLKSLAGHVTLARVNFGLFALSDFLLVPAVMALYLVLRHVATTTMLMAVGLLALFIVVDLGVTESNSLTLVTLAQHYAVAASDAQRAGYVAATDYALATLPLTTFFSYVVSSVGFLIVSMIMLKGIFSKATAYLGVVACLEGILGGFYLVLPALAALLVPCLITFGIWSLFAGSRLHKLGKRLSGVSTGVLRAA